MTTTLVRALPRPDYAISLADQVFLLGKHDDEHAARRRRRALLRRLGPVLTVLCSVLGMTLGVYVAAVTPPVSGGHLFGAALFGLSGLLSVRVRFVAELRAGIR